MHSVALLGGDGIGPDVVAEAVQCLQAVEQRCGARMFEFEELSVGAGEYLRSGSPLPDTTFERLKEFDAILLGAMGIPEVRWPDGTEMTPQIEIRERLDLYCGLRPVLLFDPNDSPLRSGGPIDILLIRENTEGLFFSRLQTVDPQSDDVRDTMRISRASSERLFRSAFDQAKRRRGLVTLVDKANVLPSMAFFRRVFDEVAAEYPELRTERVYVDAAALYLVRRPDQFDVMVTENMFGDILSDLIAGLVGGMGMAPSADIGDEYGVFQPSHGSAPDIAGKGIANPVATILSAAMMLDWLDLPEPARWIYSAVGTVFAHPANRTRDMGGSLSTQSMGKLIADAVRA